VRGLRYFFLFVVLLESCEQRKVGEGGKHGGRQLVDFLIFDRCAIPSNKSAGEIDQNLLEINGHFEWICPPREKNKQTVQWFGLAKNHGPVPFGQDSKLFKVGRCSLLRYVGFEWV